MGMNSEIIINLNEAKFVGIVIDQNLCWECYIYYVCKKLHPYVSLSTD